MAEVLANGLLFRVEIEGPASAPAILLSNSLGRLWKCGSRKSKR